MKAATPLSVVAVVVPATSGPGPDILRVIVSLLSPVKMLPAVSATATVTLSIAVPAVAPEGT